MAIAASFRFGETRIIVAVEGCMVCGIKWSYWWGTAKSIEVVVGGRKATIELYVCGDCREKRQPPLPL